MNRPSSAPFLVLLLTAACSVALACGKATDRLEVSYTTSNGVRCPEGMAACGAECVRLESSAGHCGACDHACSSTELCDLGRCRALVQGCSSSRLMCGSDCVDSLSDREHCGACDQSCPAAAECEAGACTCPGALTVCGDACVDTASDEQHCGGCEQRCVDKQSCVDGSCACPLGTELCGRATLAIGDRTVTAGVADARCVDTATDGEHCGSCDVRCVGGQVCQAGNCACPDSGLLCADRCVDSSKDAQNCGACGKACRGGQICNAGACACPTGQSLCDGQCTDTQSNADHCGSCGSACGLGEGCSAGNCETGALGQDGCAGLVRGLSISQVSAYQTVESVLARNGSAVAAAPAVVAGRPTLLRAFVTPQSDWVEREVSGRLFLANGDAEVTLYSTSTLSPAAASQANDRNSTFEFQVPAADITPDTRFALELVECGGTATGTLSSARFPASDAAELGAIDTGGLRIHIVPLRANGQLPDTSSAGLEVYRLLFLDSYPISEIELSVGDPLDIADPLDWTGNLDRVRALRQRENPAPEVYYYGMLKPTGTLAQFCGTGCTAGIGYIATGRLAAMGRAAMGLSYSDVQSGFFMLHEVGHNHGRQHAPCVPQGAMIADIDANFPQPDGTTGGIGYNALGDQMLSAASTDVMGYCPNQWFSAYTYTGLLNTVLGVNQVQASEIPDPARVGSWAVLLSDALHGLRWGEPIAGTSVAMGEEETAQILDVSGAAVQSVSVFRTRLSELDAASIEVPQPRPGWSAIRLTGAAPVAFPKPR